jgi:hypothetical protein
VVVLMARLKIRRRDRYREATTKTKANTGVLHFVQNDRRYVHAFISVLEKPFRGLNDEVG